MLTMNTLALALPPPVASELRCRGVLLEAQVDETTEQHSERLDTALMALFRDTGRRDAFDVLYEHSRERVVAWLRWLLNSRHVQLDPLELLQDTFVNVYRYAASFRSDHAASFRAWVRTIAANVIRRARTAPAARWVSTDADSMHEVVDRAGGPSMRLVQGEERDELRAAWMLFLQHYAAAFAALAPRDRRALELVEIEGLSYADTGRVLGVGPSNMKMIMLRARRRLHAHMRASLCISRAAMRSTLERGRRASA